MAAKKTVSKKTKSAKGNKGAKPAPKKTPFYGKPARLFKASTGGSLPRGSVVGIDATLPGGLDSVVRVGTASACVFEGKLGDLLTAALSKQNLKVKFGAVIPSPATKTTPAEQA